MQAVVMRDFGAPDVLELRVVAMPEPAPGEVRVRVAATAVMGARDVATRSGRHPFARFVHPPHILGGDHAGSVEAVGPGVSPGLLGRRVAVSALTTCGTCPACTADHEESCERFSIVGIHRAGAYAQYTAVPADCVHEVPDDVGSVVAAVLAATGPIAQAELEEGGVHSGDRVLVTDAAGPLGSVLVALASFRGARVVALARAGDTGWLADAGAELVTGAEGAELTQELRDVAGDAGVDVVVDNVARLAGWEAYMPVLAARGRVVVSGAVDPEPLPLDARGLYLRSQSIRGVRAGNRAQRSAFWAAVGRGFRLDPAVVRTWPLADAAEAHTAVEANGALGHCALTVDHPNR